MHCTYTSKLRYIMAPRTCSRFGKLSYFLSYSMDFLADLEIVEMNRLPTSVVEKGGNKICSSYNPPISKFIVRFNFRIGCSDSSAIESRSCSCSQRLSVLRTLKVWIRVGQWREASPVIMLVGICCRNLGVGERLYRIVIAVEIALVFCRWFSICLSTQRLTVKGHGNLALVLKATGVFTAPKRTLISVCAGTRDVEGSCGV